MSPDLPNTKKDGANSAMTIVNTPYISVEVGLIGEENPGDNPHFMEKRKNYLCHSKIFMVNYIMNQKI